MIRRLSWRPEDSRSLDGLLGTAQPLFATDTGSVTVLHLDEGASTDQATHGAGQLVIVVAGSGTVEVAGDREQIETGDAVGLPAGKPHRLSTRFGMSLVIVTYPESDRSWRVSRLDDSGGPRWIAGVFTDTERARAYRDRLRGEVDPSERVAMD